MRRQPTTGWCERASTLRPHVVGWLTWLAVACVLGTVVADTTNAPAACTATVSNELDLGIVPDPPRRFGDIPRRLLEAVPPLPFLNPEDVTIVETPGDDPTDPPAQTIDVTAAHCVAARFVDMTPSGELKTDELTPEYSADTTLLLRRTAELMAANATGKAFRRWLAIVGHNRSGSTLLGSLLDAHPEIGIGNELNAVSRHALYSALLGASQHAQGTWVALKDARLPAPRAWTLELALRSFYACGQGRQQQEFDYHVPGQWQGRWAGQSPAVLGDKNTDNLVRPLYLANMSLGMHHLELLHTSLGVPFVYVQVIRSPLDTIATEFLRDVHSELWWMSLLRKYDARLVAQSAVVQHILADAQSKTFVYKPFVGEPDATGDTHTRGAQFDPDANLLFHHVRRFFTRFDQVQAYKAQLNSALIRPAWSDGDAWLDVHLHDLTADTHKELRRVCAALQVPCSEAYLDACRQAVHSKVPRKKHLLAWPPQLLQAIRQLVRTRPLLAKYVEDIREL